MPFWFTYCTNISSAIHMRRFCSGIADMRSRTWFRVSRWNVLTEVHFSYSPQVVLGTNSARLTYQSPWSLSAAKSIVWICSIFWCVHPIKPLVWTCLSLARSIWMPHECMNPFESLAVDPTRLSVSSYFRT